MRCSREQLVDFGFCRRALQFEHAIYLLMRGHRRTAAGVVLTSLAVVAFSEGLKALIRRARPEIVPHLVEEVSGRWVSIGGNGAEPVETVARCCQVRRGRANYDDAKV